MQCTQRHQVDWAAEDLCQLIRELVDFPPEPASGPECVEDVDIAVRPLDATGAGAEDPQLGNPVPLAGFSQAGPADLDARDDQHNDTLSEACAQNLPAGSSAIRSHGGTSNLIRVFVLFV